MIYNKEIATLMESEQGITYSGIYMYCPYENI